MPGFHRSCISDKKGKAAKLDAFEALPASLPRTCRTHARKPDALRRRSNARMRRGRHACGAPTRRHRGRHACDAPTRRDA